MSTILIVEDDGATRDAMADLLRDEGYRVTTAADGVAALASAELQAPDLVISDVQMPGGDGFQLVRRLRARPSSAHIPVVLVSAIGDPGRRAVGLDLGADDFLAKPIDARELLARVRAHLRTAQHRVELERRAIVDPLTGVINRRGIHAVLHREEQRAGRVGSPLSVLMVDLDRFKALNDRLGHQAGDTALRHVARALVDAVRLVDHVGRFGGDEFLIVLPDADATAAEALASRLRGLRLPVLAIGDEVPVQVTVSIGAATLQPDDTLDLLVERADRAMYRTKRTSATTAHVEGSLP